MPVKERRGSRNVAPDEKWIAVRLPKEASERVQAWAKELGTSQSYVVRRLTIDALNRDLDKKGMLP